MNKLQIKILEPQDFSLQAIEKLGLIGDVECSSDISIERDSAEVLFIRLGYQLDREFLKNYSSLRYIVSPTTGEDHVDKEYLNEKKVCLLTLKGETEFLESIPATAEFTWGLLLSLTRNIKPACHSVIEGNWNRDLYKGHDSYGKTIALVGFGRVAKIIARYAKAFGMHVKAFDPYVDEYPEGVEACKSLASLMAGADILSIHAALTPETTNLVGENELYLLPKHAVVINTSRGDILNAKALLEALRDNTIAGAAIDVIPGERSTNNFIKNQLLAYAKQYNNLLVTPHLAGASYESMAMTEEFMVDKLIKVMGKSSI